MLPAIELETTMRALLAAFLALAFGAAHAALPDYAGPLPASQKTGDVTAVCAGGCMDIAELFVVLSAAPRGRG